MAAEKKIPEIRFKGFEGEWKEAKLGKIGDTYSGLTGKTKVDFGHGDGKYITYMNVFSNTIANPKMTEPIEIDKSQNTVKAGDVLFTTSSETPEEVGMSTIWVENAENIYLNSFCFGYRPKIKFNNNYLAYVLRSNTMRKKITFLAQGISRYNISKNRVMEIDLPIPLDEEQTQIGTYFQNLDSLISLHQRKYDKLLTVKKAMLEKMFPRQGADVPEIRFKGFEGKWEKKKLGEIADLLTGFPFESKKFTSNGIPLVRGMNVKRGYLDLSENICEYWPTSIGFESYILKEDDIIIQMDGALIGKSYCKISKNDIPALLVQRVTRIRSNVVNSNIIYQSIQKNFLGYIFTIKTETAVPHLSLNDIRLFYISFPSTIEEQTKIGTFFQNLDTQISQHQKQLEKLKNVKKACLEKMFV